MTTKKNVARCTFVLYHDGMYQAHQYGMEGEEIAVQYLVNNGYRILERNTRFGVLEIDIIAQHDTDDTIVFLEVKSRSHASDAYPIRSALTARKRSALKKAMNQWMYVKKYDGAARLDLLCVAGKRVIEHIKSIGSEMEI